MAIAAIQADLEIVAAHECGQAIAPADAHAFERDGLVQKLHASLLAQRPTVTNREFACSQRIHPDPYCGGDDEQCCPGSDHDPSVRIDDPPGNPECGSQGTRETRIAGYNRRVPASPALSGGSMKLVFPGGEHAPVELAEGVTRIGSDPACEIVLSAPGIAAHHCEITAQGGNFSGRPLDSGAPTVLNGRQIDRATPLGAGDLLVFGHVGCQVGAGAPQRLSPPRAEPKAPAIDDGRTRVRTALPKYLLRGVSGVTFGKTFAVTDNAVIGRQPDCDIPVPAEEVSRQHVRLKMTPEGLHVEDLGSANGTYINNKRVQSGLLAPGEELRLDTVRFLLLTPGMDARQQSAPSHAPEPLHAPPARRNLALTIAIIVIALAVVGFFALRASRLP